MCDFSTEPSSLTIIRHLIIEPCDLNHGSMCYSLKFGRGLQGLNICPTQYPELVDHYKLITKPE